MKYGLIGEHLGHSFSYEIHHLLGNENYEIKEIAREDLDFFMREKDFRGINVTIPYKQMVIPYLDEIDEAAKKIGAVNTIVNKDGKLYGYNTDFYGLLSIIERAGITVDGKRVFILGTGGTSKTSVAVCEHLNAGSIVRVSRIASEDCISYEQLYERADEVEVIINSTPVGMYPNNSDCPVDINKFNNLSGVVDVIYNPLTTRLVMNARKKGIKAENGLYMLVKQAVVADEIYFERKLDDSICEEVYKKVLSGKNNIILTGMPTSGKTTNGKMLAKDLNKEFIDVDALIIERHGIIKEIFKNEGEQKFRDYEQEVIEEISKRNNVVIATGGGSILRDINIDNLKQNGTIYFIDRNPELLVPMGDRPIASNVEAIKKRYEERYERYCNTCDVRIDGNGTNEEVVSLIKEKL